MDEHQKRILIVDDEPDIRLILRSILESYGYQCDEANNGVEALERIKASDYSVVLLDYSMPLMNGLKLLEKVGQASWIVRPHMIMITANSDELLRKQALNAGAAAVLAKPFDLEQVLFAIARTIQNGQPSLPCFHQPP